MIHRLSNLMWRLFGQPDVPPKITNYNPIKINEYSGDAYTPRANKMYEVYCDGMDIENIAKAYNVTRERVRQCLWKAYRESIRNNKGKK